MTRGKMNLREEISIQLENLVYYPEEKSGKEYQRRFIELFEKWALECVGEEDTPRITPDPRLRMAVNVTKETIRQRIKESIK